MNKFGMKYLIRFLVIFIFHLLFKQTDNSFSGAFEPGSRSLLFSLYFIVYWMLFWEICSLIYNKLIKFSHEKKTWYRRLAFVTPVLLILVTACSVVFSNGYFLIDHYLFGIRDTKDIYYLNPEIFRPSDIFAAIRVNPELLFGFILFFVLVFGTHVFITSVRYTRELELITAQQKRESISAQYAALKNQIDPHFFLTASVYCHL